MIALIGQMVRARGAQAVTVLLLSVFATAAAVAGPASLRAVDAAIVAHEVATADRSERVITITGLSSGDGSSSDFESLALTSFGNLPDFDLVYSNETQVMTYEVSQTRLAFREGVCEHLELVQGRCLMGMNEAVLAEDVAERQGVRAGQAVPVREAVYDQFRRMFVASGPTTYLTVAGVYRPRDAGEAYWGTLSYFPVNPDGTRSGPMFTSRRTLDLLGYDSHGLAMEAIPGPDAVRADGLAELRQRVNTLISGMEESRTQSTLGVQSGLPRLLDRIDHSRAQAHALIPMAFVPLVALCWFVIFLAVGYGVFGRRLELGLVALRGVSRARRWWLATGESLVMVLAGAPLGYLLGHLAVQLVARTRLGNPGGAELSPDALPYASLALLGALGAALLAQRRELTAPVVDLLRRVPRRFAVWRGALVEGVVVLLAVLAVVQLRGQPGELTGLSLLVPGLVIAAVAVVAARAVVPLAGAYTRYGLRRGLLGSALAAAQLARRPGSQRLFMLLTVAVGLLGFVVAAGNVSTRARADRAEIATGAPAVVQVEASDARTLQSVVRTVDPQGRWAMAVAQPEPAGGGGDDVPPVLAVDTSRLAATAAWRADFRADPVALAKALHPTAPRSFVVTGETVAVDVENLGAVGSAPVRLSVVLAPLGGGAEVPVLIEPVEPGRHVYQRLVAECTRGCRVSRIEVGGSVDEPAQLVLRELRQVAPEPAVVVSAQDFADKTRWRALESTRYEQEADGAVLNVVESGFGGRSGLAAVDAPTELPVAAATRKLPSAARVTGLDGLPIDADVVAHPAMLPRLGRDGVLVDLEYADRLSALSLPVQNVEVWLGPAAPPNAAEQLRRAGLPVLGVRYAAAARGDLDKEGPALALWFHLVAAAFALVLAVGGIGLVSAVDRRRRAEDLGALRRQGLGRRQVRRATLWGQLVVVLAGLVVGPVAAAAAWWLAGDRMPVFVDSLIAVTPPSWPQPSALWAPWAGAAAAFVVAAVLAAIDLRRAVSRNGRDV